jgi:outer membrane protein assembly factor BamA
MPSYIPYVAFSYTEENGWSVGPALASVNLFGRGIRTGARFLFGGATTFNLDVWHPWIGDDHTSLDLRSSALVRDDTLREFEERSVEVTPWVGRHWGRRGRIQGMLGWFRMRSDVGGVTLSSRNVDDWGRAGIRAGWDSRDSRILPRDGWWSEVEVVQNGGFLGGDADFVACATDVQRYVPIGAASSLALGGLLTVQSGSLGGSLPGYMDFRLGGANTVRGYAFDVLGRELSGKNQLLFTAEVRRPLVPMREIPIASWSFRLGVDAALFVDTGAAWSGELTGDRFRTGGGFGIRLVGIASEMIRFDFGFGDEIAEFHFAAWSKFTAQRRRLR